MILPYILGVMLALLLLYVLFLSVCCLFVNPEKEYDRNSPFYRFLLDSATTAAIKLLRIRVHTNGIEKIPKDATSIFYSFVSSSLPTSFLFLLISSARP